MVPSPEPCFVWRSWCWRRLDQKKCAPRNGQRKGHSSRPRNLTTALTMFSSPQARTVAVVVLLAASSTAMAQSCYYPDGSLPTDYEYVPCTGDSVSSCCIPSEGDVCLASGACYYKSRNYPFRGACTDKSWTSSKCPQYCMNREQSPIPPAHLETIIKFICNVIKSDLVHGKPWLNVVIPNTAAL